MEILHRLFEGPEKPDQGSPSRIKRFALAVVAYCADAKASVTSWYRTERRNKRVGGRPTSRHLKGLAADVVYDEPLAKNYRQAVAERHGLVILHEKNHDHLTLKDF